MCCVIHTDSQVVFSESCGAGIPISILQMEKLRLRRVKTLPQSPRGKWLLPARLFCLTQSPGRFPTILYLNIHQWVSMVQKEGASFASPCFLFTQECEKSVAWTVPSFLCSSRPSEKFCALRKRERTEHGLLLDTSSSLSSEPKHSQLVTVKMKDLNLETGSCTLQSHDLQQP